MKIMSQVKLLGILIALFMLVSCGGKQSQPQPEQTKVPVKKLAKKYDTILFSPFTITPALAKDYPQASSTLQHSAMTVLQMNNKFKKVDMAGQDYHDGKDTLLVKANITDMRIVSGAARFWGGAMAGSSGVELDLQLIDGASHKVVRDEKLSSWNNPFGAAWTGGSTDNSLLSDMGGITAQYITDAMPAK